MHNEQYDFQMFTCNAHQISAEKNKTKTNPSRLQYALQKSHML